MFELLTLILLWVLVIAILWYFLTTFINRVYLTWLGGVFVVVFLVLAFLNPNDRVVSVVWSILSFPLTPLGLAITLLLSALRSGKAERNLVLAAALILIFFSMPLVSFWLATQNQGTAANFAAIENVRPAGRDTVRAIVVLGDSFSPTDPTFGSRAEFSNLQDAYGTGFVSRLLFAAQLYREQASVAVAPVVIVSAGLPREGLAAEQAQQYALNILTEAGVPLERITFYANGTDVRSSAVGVRDILLAQGYNLETDSVILVAPVLRIQRASSTFRQIGLQTTNRATNIPGFQFNDGDFEEILAGMIPNVEALALTTRVVQEYLLSVYYFLRGWLFNPPV